MFTIGGGGNMNSKEAVLQQLREHRGNYISGENLAGQLDISRAAIWKAVDTLRTQGYQIESKSHEGYRLVKETNELYSDSILSLLDRRERERITLKVFDTIDSTNSEAKRLLAAGCKTDTVVIARSQSEGRGRLGRSFFSPDRSGLYLSYIIREPLELQKALLVTSAAAVAVTRAVERSFPIPVQIKWVNDIYKDGKKIAGILTEGTSNFENGRMESIIVGVGINLFPPQGGFPDQLKEIASSLFEHEREVMNDFAARLISELSAVLTNLDDPSIMREYREHSFVLDTDVSVITGNQSYDAHVTDIDNDGSLIVKDEKGKIHRLNSGEISIRKK